MPDDRPPMPDDFDWKLLERWLAGECTSAEAAAVSAWLAADPWNRTFLEELRRTMPMTKPATDGWDIDRAWSRMADPTGALPSRSVPRPPNLAPPLRVVPGAGRRREWPVRPVRWLATAAAVVLAVGGTLLVERAAERQAMLPAAAAPRAFTTSRGQRLELRLADGTRVTLGPVSRLEVPVEYGTAKRLVRLEGEAYFDVVHDSTRPFAVRTRYALARDLGTRFVVRARDGEPAVRVVVADGAVALGAALSAGHGGTVLTRGELGRLDSAGASSVVRGVQLNRYLAWTEGRLVFEQAPVAEAAADISRWYDIDLALGDSALAARRLTVAFHDEPLEQMLDAFAFVAHARYERSGRRVTLYPIR